MTPCPGADEAIEFAKNHPQYAIGVHLTHTNEWKDRFPWGPLTDGKSIRTPEGRMWPESEDFEAHCTYDEACAETLAQIEYCEKKGMKPSHVDSHMGALYGLNGKLKMLPKTLAICGKKGYPFRMFSKPLESQCPKGTPMWLFKAACIFSGMFGKINNVIMPDYLIFPESIESGDSYDEFKKNFIDYLTAIPDGLFDSCAKLASITLPQNITEIGQFAFNYCTSLTEIDIPKTVKTIKGYAFRNCASLKNIDVSSASEIGDFTFQYCAKLESADISGISEIPAYMFEGASLLSNVKFSDTITKIGNYAFFGCEHLPSFVIPKTVKSLGDYAFAKCGAFTEMTIPASIEALGDGLFFGSGVSNVIIKAEITELPASFFDSCKKLTTLTLPTSLESIGMGAFAECILLSEIPFTAPIKHVGDSAFAGCRALQNIVVGTEDTTIGTGTFYGCDALVKVNIPEGITSIGSSAFANCVFLESVTFPSTLKTIENSAFASCKKIARAELPSGVTMLGDSVFSGCTKLTKIDIPETVVYVGTDAFAGTQWLRGNDEDFIVVGDGILYQYNGNATNIIIPSTVKRIPDHRLTVLKTEPESITIPESVEYIGKQAFVKRNSTTDSSGNTSYSYSQRYLTIIGYEGSYAESYARYEYYTFEEIK